MGELTVILYSTPGCRECDEARAFLRNRGVAFEEVDVSSGGAGARQLIQFTGHLIVPTIVVGADAQIGFDSSRVEYMLEHPAEHEPDAFGRSRARRSVVQDPDLA